MSEPNKSIFNDFLYVITCMERCINAEVHKKDTLINPGQWYQNQNMDDALRSLAKAKEKTDLEAVKKNIEEARKSIMEAKKKYNSGVLEQSGLFDKEGA